MSVTDLLLDIRGLQTHFFTPDGVIRAVDGVDIQVPRGKTVCIVGESGSGKSAVARSVMQLVDVPGRIVAGRVLFRVNPDDPAIDLASLKPKGREMRRVRGKQISMVFQEPMSSLSPVHTIGFQITEMLRLHEPVSASEARHRAIEELRAVGIPDPDKRYGSYSFQMSGGMRQRVMLAIATICRPQLLIADEPTTALDVTTQAQILDLLAELKSTLGMTLVFVTHDLGIVAEIADQVVVMNGGKVVESGTVDAIFHDPQHSYTQRLLMDLPQRRARVHVSSNDPLLESAESLLQIHDLRFEFPTTHGRGLSLRRRRTASSIIAVDGVSLTVESGKTMGLVGESGSGKTTLGRCILRAYRPTSGSMHYRTKPGTVVDLATLSRAELQPYRQEIRMIFQDPYGSLNPRMTVRQIVAEPLRSSRLASGSEADDRVAEMLRRVGLTPDHGRRYPHAFSGGQRQRIGIARALITGPRLVVADEAVSALDVSIRGQILDLLQELQEQLSLTYLFISHDLSVVESICDDVVVLYRGRIVEQSTTQALYANPQHPYTQALISAVPIPDPRLRGTRTTVTYQPETGTAELVQ